MRTRSIPTATALAVLFSSAALSVADGALQRVFVGDHSAGKIVASTR